MPDRLGVEYWRARAREARVQAGKMSDLTARRALLGIAEKYEQIAEQAERIQKTGKPAVEA